MMAAPADVLNWSTSSWAVVGCVVPVWLLFRITVTIFPASVTCGVLVGRALRPTFNVIPFPAVPVVTAW